MIGVTTTRRARSSADIDERRVSALPSVDRPTGRPRLDARAAPALGRHLSVPHAARRVRADLVRRVRPTSSRPRASTTSTRTSTARSGCRRCSTRRPAARRRPRSSRSPARSTSSSSTTSPSRSSTAARRSTRTRSTAPTALLPAATGYDPDFDPDYDPDNYDGHGNDNVTHSVNANNVDEHVVSIEATNYMQFMNVTGVFGFKIPPQPRAQLAARDNGDRRRRHRVSRARTASRRRQGGKGGVGGAFFVQILNNTTHAIVETGRQALQRHAVRPEHQGRGSDHQLRLLAGRRELRQDRGRRHVRATSSRTATRWPSSQEGSEITGGRVDVYAGSLETADQLGRRRRAEQVDRRRHRDRDQRHRPHDARGHRRGQPTRPARRARPGRADDQRRRAPSPRARSSRAASTRSPSPARSRTPRASRTSRPDRRRQRAGHGRPARRHLACRARSAAPATRAASRTRRPARASRSPPPSAVNIVNDTTQASLSDYTVNADAVDVKARNEAHIVAATGGLAFSKTDAGGNAVALAGAFSYNGVDAHATPGSATPRSLSATSTFEQVVVETAEKRLSVTADTVGDVWTLAAGGAGAVAGGGTRATTAAARSRSRWPARSR